MKNPTDTKDAAASTTTPATVQTSAQPEAEVLHKQPSTGGSYTRNPATGDLVKNGPPVAATDKE
jgi:hypothetical protein